MFARLFFGRWFRAIPMVALLGPCDLTDSEPLPDWAIGRNGEFYVCHRAFPLSQGEVYYFTRVLPNNPPSKYLDDAVGKAFVRHVVNLNPAINRKTVLEEEFNWSQACATSWPYGVASLRGIRDQYTLVGGKEIDWEYAPDKDLTVTPLPPAEKKS